MTKPTYYIEARFKSKLWTVIKTERNKRNAYNYIRTHADELAKYPLRVVQVHRTVIFDNDDVK